MITILKHIVIRIGAIALIVYLFLTLAEKFKPETTGNYPSLGFILSVFGIGALLTLIISGGLIIESILLYKKKKITLLAINLILLVVFGILLSICVPKL